jgi:hypothetical protein
VAAPRGGDAAALGLVVIASLPLSLLALDSFFSFDDLHNLYHYVERPWETLAASLLVCTSFRRPLGGLLYLGLYHSFGMDPFPLYLTGVALFSANVVLLHTLWVRLTSDRLLAGTATALASFHPAVHNVLFNFGAVYELLALAGMLAGLHCYVSFRRSGAAATYLASLVCFALALDAKETAVVLPAVLLLYELVYLRPAWRSRAWLGALLARSAPFWGLAAAYSAAKILGAEALWRGNRAYQYQPDLTFYRNLASYVEELGLGAFRPSDLALAALLAGLAGAALLLRNRHVIFGAGFGLLALLPVLPLPRVWALFLYAALPGFALCLAALVIDLVKRLGERLGVPGLPARGVGTLARYALLTVVLGAIVLAVYPRFRAGRTFYTEWSRPWQVFAEQLWTMYPELPEGAALAFEDPPFDAKTWERYGLHFLVWLKYGKPGIAIYRMPEQRAEFEAARGSATESHVFSYRDGVLRERPNGEGPAG